MSALDALSLRSLGLQRTRVELVDGDPRWTEAYARLEDVLASRLDGAAIEHVGSTAVPGLRAKPILDVAVGVSVVDEADLTARLAPAGLELRGDTGGRGGLLFVLEDGPERRVAHVHVVELGGSEWLGYLAFRDRLRRDPAARDEYEQLKETLAARFARDRTSYTAGKEGFIEALVADELGLQLRERIQSPPTV